MRWLSGRCVDGHNGRARGDVEVSDERDDRHECLADRPVNDGEAPCRSISR